MKKIIGIVILVLCFLSASSQETFEYFVSNDTLFETQSRNWEFSDVIKLDTSLSKIQIYNSILDWAQNFSDQRIEISISDKDKDNGVLYLKVMIKMRDGVDANLSKIQAVDGKVYFTTTIQCKKGKYKYTMTGFNHKELPLIFYKTILKN